MPVHERRVAACLISAADSRPKRVSTDRAFRLGPQPGTVACSMGLGGGPRIACGLRGKCEGPVLLPALRITRFEGGFCLNDTALDRVDGRLCSCRDIEFA